MRILALNKKSKIISFAVVSICLAILWCLDPVCYHNNDDRVLMFMTAGYFTGKNEIASIFGSFYWYGLIAGLYRIYKGLCWYTILQLVVIAASLWTICNSFIRIDKNNKGYWGILFFVFMFFNCFMLFSTALQYTVTASFAGAAAASLAISTLTDEAKDRLLLDFFLELLFLIIAYGIRKQFGLVSLSSVLIIEGCRFLFKRKKEHIKRVMIIVIVFIIALLSNKAYEVRSGLAEFNEYYAEAGKWMDYPHGEYAEYEQVYNEAGWDETLYNAVSNWYFLDENVNTDSFKIINEAYQSHSDDNKQTLNDKINRLKPNMVANSQVFIWIMFLIASHLGAFISSKNWRTILIADVLFAMFILLIVYFLNAGRLPLRAYQALIIIYGVPSILACAKVTLESYNKKIMILLVVLITVGMNKKIPATCMIKETYSVTHDSQRLQDIQQSMELNEYGIEHEDNLYIYDVDLSLPVAAFATYPDKAPTNVMLWGNWHYNSPVYWRQVQKNGFNHIYSKELLDERVFVCTREEPTMLVEYMKKRYPNSEVEKVDEFDGISVYKFRE